MLKDILAISGQPGLYKLISQAKNGIIVESLETGTRMPAYATTKISALEDIAIFTEDEEVPLVDVFKNIYNKESGGDAIDYKSPGENLREYFSEILPAYDRERVYVSDIKKVINWYNILNKLKVLRFEDEKEDTAPVEDIENSEIGGTGETTK